MLTAAFTLKGSLTFNLWFGVTFVLWIIIRGSKRATHLFLFLSVRHTNKSSFNLFLKTKPSPGLNFKVSLTQVGLLI